MKKLSLIFLLAVSLAAAPSTPINNVLLSGPVGYKKTPITVTSHAGTIDATKGLQTATDNAACTLTMSADNTAAGKRIPLELTNSAATAIVYTLNNQAATLIGYVSVPEGTTQYVTLQTTGTGAVLLGGDPGAPDGSHLGTFAAPDTTAGAVLWTGSVLKVFTSASAALRTYTLPAAAAYADRGIIIYVVAGTNHVNVQPASGAALVLAGTLLTANHYVQAGTSAAGNFICFVSDGTNWVSLGSSGTWADAAGP